MVETPAQMADRIEREALSLPAGDDREYGLMVAAVIRRRLSEGQSDG